MRAQALVAGKYRILSKLGEGGMGSVWLAKNEVTERDFAIKFLHEGTGTKEGQLARFFGEAKVAGRLRHPSIVEIFDAGTEPTLGGAPYLVMELLEGVGLDEAVRRRGGLPLGVSLEILVDVSRALSLAHDKGIIHRDLKAANVFLHRVGTGALVPKVLDFGISKVLVDETTGKHMSSGMTRTGALLGSPLYMSPEQAAGDKSIDARSDVHSLGVLLWECLTGLPPFTADTYGLLLVEIIQGERRSLDSVLPSVPPGVSQLVARAIARNRDERFANAGEFATALEEQLEALGHEPELSGRTSANEFLEKLGGPETERKERATSTTAAVSVPSPSVPVAPAKSAQVTPPHPGAYTDEPVSIPKTKRAPLWIAVAGLVIGGIVIAALSLRPRNTEQPTGEAPPPTSTEAVPATTTPNVTPEVTTSATTQPSAMPVASETPRPRVVVQPRATGKKPAAPTTSDKPSGPAPVHHGVTNSGL